MTNGEKFKQIFSITQVDEGELYAFAWLPNHDAAEFSIDWWNAEYKEPKPGHWIDINGIYAECSNCNEEIYITGDFKFCPNCGAKMIEPQESEG